MLSRALRAPAYTPPWATRGASSSTQSLLIINLEKINSRRVKIFVNTQLELFLLLLPFSVTLDIYFHRVYSDKILITKSLNIKFKVRLFSVCCDQVLKFQSTVQEIYIYIYILYLFFERLNNNFYFFFFFRLLRYLLATLYNEESVATKYDF